MGIIEKAAPQRMDADTVCDITRAMVTCKTFKDHCHLIGYTSTSASDGAIMLERMKQRYEHPSTGGWRDIMINVSFPDEGTRHICEVQIVHEKMVLLRSGDGHGDYNACHAAAELLESIRGVSA